MSRRFRTSSSRSREGDFGMARQPLPKKFWGGPLHIGIDVVGHFRPELLVPIGQCVTQWSFVEHQMAILLGILMDAQTEAAMALFTSLRTGPVKRDALKSVAQAVLSPKDITLLKAILEVEHKFESHRNDVVHGHWGVHEKIADGLLWVPSNLHASWNAGVLISEKSVKSHPTATPISRPITTPL